VRAIQSHGKDNISSEKPLMQCRIVLIDIDQLHGHEQVVESQVDYLKTNLQELGYFFRPILVVKKHNVVLDGHHRVQALKELGGVRIPCIEIPYLNNPDITLATWFPIYTGSSDVFPKSFKKLNIEWKQVKGTRTTLFSDPNYGFALYAKNGQWILKGSQKEIFKIFLENYNSERFEYVKTTNYAVNSVNNGYSSFALLRKTLTKQDVINTAKSGNVYAPKTTRHILTYRYQDIKVPLENLFD
jgi:hypothetical protein